MSQQSMTSENTESIWKPTKKQLEFLKAGSIFEVAYLGGAGSGKSNVIKQLGLEKAGFIPVYVNELNKDAMDSYLINRLKNNFF